MDIQANYRIREPVGGILAKTEEEFLKNLSSVVHFKLSIPPFTYKINTDNIS